MTAETLRRLHEKATPGPWIVYDDSGQSTKRIEVVAIGKTIAHIYQSVPEVDAPNAELFTYLRNHAADFIAIIEAAKAIPDAQELWDEQLLEKHLIPVIRTLQEALKPFAEE